MKQRQQKRTKPTTCAHPPHRLYDWIARDDREPTGRVLCIGCCDCGAMLRGGA